MGNRGPQPGTGGRPRKPLADKMSEGRATKYAQGKMPLPEPVDLVDVEMPPPHEFLSDEQKNGQELIANEIYQSTWEWLRKYHCEQMVTQQNMEQYAVTAARWIQCEKAISTFGFLAKHSTTGAPITSPYVSMAREYSKHANALWKQNAVRASHLSQPAVIQTVRALVALRRRPSTGLPNLRRRFEYSICRLLYKRNA